ncbi:hypothetical protein SteCoe_24313 [Stentor coeruleus]|uniref:Golgin subfamily A member 7/ERF4 domain-containing protein n=1 Tax=Stentor coeruleus TaxID=5963 RepID=A0A1R2BHS2_9CILI|nr:hypothetical protein SteCoe_24313 [Stentor coeruleus]
MDCIFNKQIPESTEKIVIIRPSSKTFITGLASSYDETYPKILQSRVSVEEWSAALAKINEALFYYWPCFMCMSFGYCFSPCTLGLSFCLPGMRINEAKQKVIQEMNSINKDFSRKGMKLKLVQKCSTSWIEVELEEILAMDTDNSQL